MPSQPLTERLDPVSPGARAALIQIKTLRQRLLDLSTRNKLISFKHNARSSKSFVRVIDADIQDLFEHLTSGKPLELVPLPHPPDEPPDEQTNEFRDALEEALLTDKKYLKEVELIEAEERDDSEAKIRSAERALRDRLRRKLKMPSRSDAMLTTSKWARENRINPEFELSGSKLSRRASQWQALLYEDDLARRLRSIWYGARESQNEFGINTLNFVFGFLEWSPSTPSGESEEVIFSPIILSPVDIRPRPRRPNAANGRMLLDSADQDSLRGSKEEYVFCAGDSEDPHVNLALKERLREDHGIILPEWDDENLDLEVYFEQLQHAISSHPNWSVRHFATLSHLSFSRYPMWLDLDPDIDELTSVPPHLHPIVGELFGGKDDATGQGDGDADSDRDHLQEDVPFVVDCDPSQHVAIRRALKGGNLVIQGPPGTGKSQTIANLIAAALDQGQTVLFVAEKQVALEVVFKRLAEVGLGDFILQLHSAKGGKQSVLHSLKKRLEIDTPSVNQSADARSREELGAIAAKLDAYATAMNSLFGAVEKSVHDIVWDEISLKDKPVPQSLGAFYFEDVETWTRDQWRIRKEAATEWEEITDLVKIYGVSERWAWVTADDLFVDEQSSILHLLGEIAAQTEALEKVALEAGVSRESLAYAALGKTIAAIESLGPRPSARKGMWSFAKRSAASKEAEAVYNAFSLMHEEAAWLQKEIPGIAVDPEVSSRKFLRLDGLAQSLQATCVLTTYDDLFAERETCVSAIANIPHVNQLLNDLASLTRVPDLVTLSDGLTFAAGVFTLAADTPPELIGRKTKLGDSESQRMLRDVAVEIHRVNEAWLELKGSLRASTCEAPSCEILEAAKQLKEGGFLAWLRRPAYRKAVPLARSLFGKEKAKGWPDLLSRLGACRADVERLEAHPAKDVVSHVYKGVDTDTAVVLAMCDWAEAVRAHTPAVAVSKAGVRDAMFAAAEDLHAYSKALVDQGWPDVLKNLAALAQKHNASPAELPAALEKHVASIDKVLEICEELGLKQRIDADYRDVVRGHLKSLAEASATIKSKSEVCGLLLPDTNVSKAEFKEVRRCIGVLQGSGLSAEQIEKLGSDDGLALWEQLKNSQKRLDRARKALGTTLGEIQKLSGQTDQYAESWQSLALDALAKMAKECSADDKGLNIRCRLVANRILTERLGLRSFVSGAYTSESVHFADAGELFERVAMRSLCRKALNSFSALKEFRQASPSALRKRFQECDSQLRDLNIRQIVHKLSRTAVPRGQSAGRVKDKTEKGLIDYMVNHERPRTTLRELLKRSARALQALKPCFMMSPLSVAQLLERGRMTFDMVIFDEASQIRPEDAVSSLLRAKQFVIVGDPMQLPPTNFGVKSSGGLVGDEEDSEDDLDLQESILDVAARSYGIDTKLRRHYRSRDPALISFSNREFYDDELEIFPAPFHSNPDTGVKFIAVEGIYAQRRNLIEARKTASEVVEYMKKYPGRSIGVVATNMPQAELIEYELDKLIAEDAGVIAYTRKWDNTLEPLFVKNLESVQGDERDVIFISTVFGHDEEGNFYQRFGPINSVVGHRRLNVLFTRAKYQVVVVSSIPIQKIQLGKPGGGSVHRGVSIFRKYLDFASTGQLKAEAIITTRGYDSPFEQAVGNALKRMGYDCVPQIGVKGFFIDLAIRHPRDPDQFILGIECDGASYHSSRVARDRDRLRQEILENLGWQLHRVWSTDWFADQERELSKLKEAVRSAISSCS